MLRSFFLLPMLGLSMLGLGACAGVSTSRVNTVVVTDSKAVVASCTKLGDIDGGSTLGKAMLRDTARDSALARLKTGGAQLGGTHVQSSVADIRWRGRDTSGVVYKCST